MSESSSMYGGKKVSFSKQQYNFPLDSQRNEMYSLERYLAGRLRQYCFQLAKMRFLDMIHMTMQNLLNEHIPKEDCELLLYCFAYLKTITNLLDGMKKRIKKNTKIDKFVDELHDIFTVPSSAFVGYNQLQLLDTLRLIYDNLEVREQGPLRNTHKKFYEICVSCEDNPTFLQDYKNQLKFWRDILSGKPQYLPTSPAKMVLPVKSILKKP